MSSGPSPAPRTGIRESGRAEPPKGEATCPALPVSGKCQSVSEVLTSTAPDSLVCQQPQTIWGLTLELTDRNHSLLPYLFCLQPQAAAGGWQQSICKQGCRLRGSLSSGPAPGKSVLIGQSLLDGAPGVPAVQG